MACLPWSRLVALDGMNGVINQNGTGGGGGPAPESDAESASDAAEARVKEMCEKLLANTVIESYRFELMN